MVKGLAARYKLPCLDTQALLDSYVDEHHSFSLSKDRVHLNMSGHMLLAKAFLSLIGADIFK
jgi:lysophospholipase L1-like esterase